MNKISAIIPTLNRPKDLRDAVASILRQKHLPNELIIVDQSVDDQSYNAVNGLYEEFDVTPKLVYLHEPEVSGLIEAKQRGVQIAKGDIISFLEDDVVLHRQYFENAISIFKNNQEVIGCCGVMSNVHSGTLYEYLFKLFHRGIFYDPRLNAGKNRDCQGSGVLLVSRYLSGGISCYRKEVFEKVNFDMVNDFFMLEDIDFSTRAADFFGDEHFFISTNMCLDHNMSPINRARLKERWQRKLREYVTFYKKHSDKPWSSVNLIWLLIGMLGESIVSSVLSKNIGPLTGTMAGLYDGIRKKVVI
jgi:GT2 family glycosyltransferase